MKTLAKVLLGVFSFVPLVFFGLFFGWLIPAFFHQPPNSDDSVFATRFKILLPLAVATSIIFLLLTLLYAVLLARRQDLHVAEKVAVPIGIFFTNGIVLPLVWWLYIWRQSNLASFGRRSG